MDIQDTFVAISTPHGESALGVIRCSGPLCPDLIHSIFKSDSPTPRRAYFSNYTDLKGNFLDQVVYSYFPKNHSYTGDSMLEISCHGNPFILHNVLNDLVNRGCRLALPGEFTQTAFLNGKMDLSQAEAVIDLIKARTDLSFKAASNQLRGLLRERIDKLVEDLIQLIAEVEAYIDFPEEDLPMDSQTSPKSRIDAIIGEIEELSKTARTGIFLREGVKAIIVGEPNAGKSSLLNKLLGESRAIVSDQPGTTRDYIEAAFFIDPYRINIIDTAGIHNTDNPIEKDGIRKTLEQIRFCDIVLLTIDLSAPPPLLTTDLLEMLHPEKTLVIFNKVDLKVNETTRSGFPDFQKVEISALTGSGFHRLRNQLSQMIGNPEVSDQGDVLAVSARHHTALENAKSHLDTASDLFIENVHVELLASHLREGLTSLEAIVGRVDNERILDKLFSSFCIGK